MRMLDADAEGADWREVARIVLHIDSEREPAWARRAFDTGSVGDFQLPTAAGDDVAFALGGQAMYRRTSAVINPMNMSSCVADFRQTRIKLSSLVSGFFAERPASNRIWPGADSCTANHSTVCYLPIL
jgi:hypothetical protein